MRCLIALRQGSAPRTQWFNAMRDALDKECALANSLDQEDPTCAYERALGTKHNVSDLACFYSPARFVLDKGGLPNKFAERARAGFWVGRDISFVMNGTVGSAIFWDGNIHRTVLNNFYIQQGKFLGLTAPSNRLLPEYPDTPLTVQDVTTAPAGTVAAIPPAQSIVPESNPPPSADAIPLSLTRPKRSNADTHRAHQVPLGVTALCMLCASAIYMGECGACKEVACVFTPEPVSDNRLSPVPRIPTMAVPTMRSVISFCSGNYYAADGFSAQMRAIGKGVIDIDNDEAEGGGRFADLTANTVWSFALLCLESRIIVGSVSGEPCASGSAVRFRTDPNRPGLPEPSRDVAHPDGKPGMSLEYQKEIHTSELLSYRITYFNEKLFCMGGWFVGECPGMRGDSGSPLLFDPALSEHSSVMRGRYWLRLQRRTGAILVSSHMCALRPNDYPPKPEDFMLSPNLRDAVLGHVRNGRYVLRA